MFENQQPEYSMYSARKTLAAAMEEAAIESDEADSHISDEVWGRYKDRLELQKRFYPSQNEGR